MEYNGLSEAPPQRRRWRRILILACALVVLGYLLFPPLAPLEKANLIGYSICHQIPDRSFHLAEHRLPLCARCTGTYLGVAIGFAALALLRRWRSGEMLPMSMIIVMVCFLSISITSSVTFFIQHHQLSIAYNDLRTVQVEPER